jgi:hypothetical protein
MSTTTDFVVATGLVFTDARRLDLPDPVDVRIARDSRVLIHLETLADLAQWAQWAEAAVTHGDPTPHVGNIWAVAHQAEGAIAELRVHLAAIEIGVMTEPDTFDCSRCGAKVGTSGGFVAMGAYDDTFEREVTRHQDGACTFAGATR